MTFRTWIVLASLAACFGWQTNSKADLFHANNFLVGDRAVGLGGAFAAVADDASAIVYNPAGMAFAQSSKFIGSGTAFYARDTVYRNALGSEDFKESSSGSVPSFFGLLQQLEGLGKGASIGVAFYSPDSDSKSQNDLFRRDDLGVRNFHRTISSQSSTSYFGIGGATRIGGAFAVGFAANLVKIDELTQEYQEVTRETDVAGLVLTPAAQQRGKLYTDLTQNRRLLLDVMAAEPMVGLQWVPVPELAIGVTLRKPFIVSQQLKQEVDLSVSNRFSDDSPFTSGDIADGSEESWLNLRSNGVKVTKQNPGFSSAGTPLGAVEIDEPLGGLPAELRVGMAWFASSRFLLTADASYRLAPEVGEIAAARTEDIVNYHLGAEYYLTPSLPLRAGLFTNLDARPDLQRGRSNQEEQIDFYGGAIVLAWAAGNVQIGLGTVAQIGSGEAQKIAGDKNIQKVESTFYSAVLSAATAM
jgi:long-chain fatty acid transport protein